MTTHRIFITKVSTVAIAAIGTLWAWLDGVRSERACLMRPDCVDTSTAVTLAFCHPESSQCVSLTRSSGITAERGLETVKDRRGRIVVVNLLMAATLFAGPLVRAGEAASATGLAHFTFDDGTLRTVSFSATSRGDDTAVGKIDINDRTPIPNQDVDGTGDPTLAASARGVTVNAQVDCLIVDGTRAVLGGQVTGADVGRYLGKYVFLFVEDRGRASARVNWAFFEPGDDVSCDNVPSAAYAPREVTGGSVKVRP